MQGLLQARKRGAVSFAFEIRTQYVIQVSLKFTRQSRLTSLGYPTPGYQFLNINLWGYACYGTCVEACAHVEARGQLGVGFSPSTKWISRIKLKTVRLRDKYLESCHLVFFFIICLRAKVMLNNNCTLTLEAVARRN